MASSIGRQSQRCFSTAQFIGSSIPGLRIYPNFLSQVQQKELQESALGLHQMILSRLQSSPTQSCTTYLSKYHNLKSKEYYRLVPIEDELGEKINGQHFEQYGDEGHKLTYFIGNQNLPEFIKSGMLPRVLQIPEVSAYSQGIPLNWNFTFNTYAITKDRPSKLPGFDFHKDIKSNGEITMIYSCGAPAEFQIRLPQEPTSIQRFPLLSNGLVLLSKEARWDYEHCVVPLTGESAPSLLDKELALIKRISLVLGCSRLSSRRTGNIS